MLDLLEIFRIRFAGRPLLLCLAIALTTWVVVRRRPLGKAARSQLAWAPAAAGAIALATYAAIAIGYASDDHYFDAAEPTITAVGWLFALGQPLYHDVDAAARYAHIYGPMAFISHGLVLRAFGPSIEASKLLGAIAALASLACTWLALRRTTTNLRAWTLTGGCALVYLMFRNYTFWTRPEPLQLLCVGAGLLAALTTRSAGGSVALGLCMGVLWNLKITGPLYALPLLVLVAHRAGTWPVLVAVVAAIVAAAAPFALPNVSFTAWLTWVRLSAHNGLLLALLRQNIEWTAFLLLPLLVAFYPARAGDRPADREWRWFAGTLVLAMIGVAIAASKPGAGPYHLMPFVPLIAYGAAAALRGRDALAPDRSARVLTGAWIAAACLVALVQQTSFLRTMQARDASDEASDLRAFLAAHPTLVVEMGYAGDDRLTFARPSLLFRTGAYTIDAPAVQEHQLSGVTLPPATLDAIHRCHTDVWLIPRGFAPFEGPNRYPQMQRAPLFSDAFKAAFHEAYVHDGTTRYYDVWRCRARRAS
jgi:hypothetical protein